MPLEPEFPSAPVSTTDHVILCRLLGPCSVWQPGRVLPHVITGPTLNLFGHLLLRPGQRRWRETLNEAIWPDSDCRSRAGFNTTLWRLRQFLAPLAGVTLDAVR